MASRAALPARYPPIGTWPALMPADMAAAYLGFADTRELARAVGRGEAPPPIAHRRTGRARQPIWSRAAIDHFSAQYGGAAPDKSKNEDLASLV